MQADHEDMIQVQILSCGIFSMTSPISCTLHSPILYIVSMNRESQPLLTAALSLVGNVKKLSDDLSPQQVSLQVDLCRHEL